jgi:hypothetical protein
MTRARKHNFTTEMGKLTVQSDVRRGGKITDRWTFRDVLNDKSLEVVLSLVKKGADLYFVAACDEIKYSATDTDIARLYAKVRDDLKTQAEMRAADWETWVEVESKGAPRLPDNWNAHTSYVFEVRYRRLRRLVTADGKAWTIDREEIVPFPSAKDRGVEGSGVKSVFGGFEVADNTESYSYAYLPATQANIAALDDLMVRMAELNQRLAGLLCQNEIQNTLDNIKSTLALAAPDAPMAPSTESAIN